MNNKFTKTLVASVITLSVVSAQAALFQLAEVSTSGLGMAYAGNAAVADNASVVATNPALMTKFKSAQLSGGGVLVDTNIKIYGTTANGNNAYAENVVPTSFIPNLYFTAPITDDFSVGLGYNVNYGLRSEYEDNYNAGTLGGKTELAAHNFNVSGAYNLGHGFSVGVGLNAIYSDAEIRRTLGDQADALHARANTASTAAAALTTLLPAAYQSVPLGQLASSPAFAALAQNYPAQIVAAFSSLAKQYPNQTATEVATQLQTTANVLNSYNKSTVVSRITGNEWSFGWNAGLTYDLDENNRWGLAYHSAVDVKFKGHYTNDILSDLGSIHAAAGQRKDGRLTLNLPAYWEFSGYHKLTDRFAVQYSWKRTEWDRLKSLDAYDMHNESIRYLNKQENFRTSNHYALGVSYDATQDLTLRAGIAYDRNGSVTSPSISIPDTNRVWYSAGATYRFTPNLSADVGYAYLRGTSFSFKEDGANFKTRARGNLYGLNVNYKF